MHAPLPLPRLRPLAGTAVFCLALLMFALLAGDLLRHGPVTSADPGISTWFHGRMHPALTRLLLAVTHMHSTAGLALMTAAAAALLLWRRQRDWVLALALCVPGGQFLNALMKHVFERARPAFDTPLPPLASYSFPSGHTAGATVWWGFMLALYLRCERRPVPRAAAAAFAVAMVLATAVSRVYLGVHYPSDVLAAMAEGVAWLVLCFTLLDRVRGPASTLETA